MMEPTDLCKQFAHILDGKASVMEGVCLATGNRENIHPTILGREAHSFMYIPKAFSFESMDASGNALCLGEIMILEEEINPFITKLNEGNIDVTALHNHFLFDDPRLMFIHFQAIDQPLRFAQKVATAMKVLTTKEVNFDNHGIKGDDLDLSGLMDEFNHTLGGVQHTLSNGAGMVMIPRKNIHATIMGRQSTSFLTNPEMYAFNSVTSDGMALCSGEVMVLEDEINPFIRNLRKENLTITALHNHWLFDNPRLMYIHFLEINHPIRFANKVNQAKRALNTQHNQQSNYFTRYPNYFYNQGFYY